MAIRSITPNTSIDTAKTVTIAGTIAKTTAAIAGTIGETTDIAIATIGTIKGTTVEVRTAEGGGGDEIGIRWLHCLDYQDGDLVDSNDQLDDNVGNKVD